jgi:anti-sigma factor RsiW
MDGELDAEMRGRVEQALVDDAGARVRLERMRAADERLKSEIPLSALQPNDALSARILDGTPLPSASRPPLRPRPCRRRTPWATGTAASSR